MQRVTVLLIGLAVVVAGCDGVRFKFVPRNAAVQSGARPGAPGGKADAASQTQDAVDATRGTEVVDFSFSGRDEQADSTEAVPVDVGALEKRAATRLVMRLIGDSVNYAPTLVVWVLDGSRSADPMVREIGQLIRQPYTQLAAQNSGRSRARARLLTAVATIGREVEFLVDPPSPDPLSFAAALDRLSIDESGSEATFSTLERVVEKYLAYRTQRGQEILLVLISDEAGDDVQRIDGLAKALKEYGIPLYVLGVPAPFGRLSAMPEAAERPLDRFPDPKGQHPIRQGPESFALERLQLGDWGLSSEFELIDSGFGPFGLERLCRESGGRFLALRPRIDEFSFSQTLAWPPADGPRFPAAALRGYEPDYVSATGYRRLLEDNAARRALHEAAQIRALVLDRPPQLEFRKRSEADLLRRLSRAQQFAARLEPAINLLYETLQRGESARPQLTGKRWQAGFDLAMGRAAAWKARVEGYNTVLAALKRESQFQQSGSSVWVLRPVEHVEADSRLRRLVDQAQSYLRRVVDQHPDTPWYVLARRELELPMAWRWTER